MVTKQRRKKPVRRTPESYRKEVSEITNGEYSVLGDFRNVGTKILHVHNECEYEWEMTPSNFIHAGSRCPKCYGRIIRTPESYKREVSEITDGEYSVLEDFKGAFSKIKHLHNVCGHVWEVTPNNFINSGRRCPNCDGGGPNCAGGVNRSPESYRREVDEITNGEYSVLGRFRFTGSKILHAHNVCGHEWEVTPNNFMGNGSRCPKCARRPPRFTPNEYRKEVSDITNGEYSVLGEYVNAKTKIKHLHLICGNVWEETPSNFTNAGSRCPKCVFTIDRRKTNEHFVAEVYDLVGDEYTFLDEYINNYTKIRVLHKDCGHSYRVSPSTFTSRGSRCPNCVYSRGEKAVADVLDSLSIEYIREHTFEYLGRKRYDFFIPSLNIAIEYDGQQHYDAVEFWGGEEALKRTQESDALKNDFCDFMGIDLLRIPYWEFDNIDEIVANFIDTVKLMRSISDNSSEMAKCR